MLKGLGDLGNLMKLQKEFKSAQKKITGTTREGTGADGAVKAVMSGEYHLVSLSIDPNYLKGASPRDLEKAVVTAVNGAVAEIKDFSVSEMGKLTGGLNIPGLGDFLK
jgi:DNA-binding YbaB/EbfC family protein